MSDPYDELAAMQGLVRAEVARVRTCIPAQVVDYNHTTQRATVQICVRYAYRNEDGEVVQERNPTLGDVPVMFPGGSGYAVTFPLSAGDEVLLLVSERSIDEYLQTGARDCTPRDLRRFSLTDAVVLPVFVCGPVPSSGRAAGAAVVQGSDVRLGSSTATDYVALASKVATQLSTLVAAYNAHVHLDPVSGSTSAPTVPAVPPTSASLAATKVKAE